MKKIITIAMAAAMLLSIFGLVSSAVIYKGDSNMTVDTVEVQTDGVSVIINWNLKADNVWDPYFARGDDYMAGVWYEAAICITDDDYNVQAVGDVPMWWSGVMDYPYGWEEGNIMSMKVSSTVLGVSDIHGIFKLVRPGEKFEGCKVCWAIEERGTAIPGDGILQAYFEQNKYDWETENGANWCLATKAPQEGVYDVVFCEIYDIWLESDSIADSEKESRKAAETTAPTETTAAPADDTTAAPADDTTAAPADDGEPEENGSAWIYIAIAAAAVIIAAVIAVIAAKKKK